jgi:hypothetical protein
MCCTCAATATGQVAAIVATGCDRTCTVYCSMNHDHLSACKREPAGLSSLNMTRHVPLLPLLPAAPCAKCSGCGAPWSSCSAQSSPSTATRTKRMR